MLTAHASIFGKKLLLGKNKRTLRQKIFNRNADRTF